MGRNLLLVDDEQNIIRSLTRLLRRDGYTILTANSGRDGLAILAENPVGVILSDQRMPQMSGVEFLSQVKDLYPETVRMVLSGYTDLKSITDAINEGAIYKFLTKPWDDELLRANVEEAFRQYELVSENQRLTDELERANKELAAVNQDLEVRVREKTRSLEINLRALQIAQEVLEHLPAAVLGVDDNGMIAVANRRAHQWLSENGTGLVGRDIGDVLSPQMSALITPESAGSSLTGLELAADRAGNGRRVNVWCDRMGQDSRASGYILVLLPS